ncbi:MAG: hypothetical protein EBX40_03470 [Gammaproteobacteria bacterium]|nr:hypothetical protein [Gammaproteobacteria bacterium]
MEQYQCSVEELLRRFASEGLSSKEVAVRLECGVSNVRRIARKCQIQFGQPGLPAKSKLLQSASFLDKTPNSVNILSRRWCLPKQVDTPI